MIRLKSITVVHINQGRYALTTNIAFEDHTIIISPDIQTSPKITILGIFN